jgi:outer membrane protein assembly factor BamB
VLRGLACSLLALVALAGDWPQFRGPRGAGVSEDGPLPAAFSPTRNVGWKTPLPPGHSSPIVVGDRIFLTAAEGGRLLTIALDRNTGRVLWSRPAPRPRTEAMQPTNSPASPTPVSDGHMIYVFFGDFGLLAYSLDGVERWRRPLGPFNNPNGHGSSPIVVDDLLILICDQDTDSYLIALDHRTGEVRWKVERPEVTRGYVTPGVFRPAAGPVELIVPGAYQLISYEAATGRKLWWVTGMAWQLKGVPLIDGDTIYVNAWEIGGDTDTPPVIAPFADLLSKHDKNRDGRISAAEAPPELGRWYENNDLHHDGIIEEREWNFYRLQKSAQNAITAIRHGGEGDITATNVLWRYRKSLPNTPSPLLYRGILYLVKDGGVATTLDPSTGAVRKQARLPGAQDRYWASPVAGDGKVYLVSEACRVTVLRAAGDWEVLASNDLDDTCFATPALAGGHIFLRTRSALYSFGEQ